MATLDYRSSLLHYRRYLSVVQKRPILRASLFLILSLVLLIILVATALRPTLVTIAGLLGDLNQQKSIESRMDEKINQLAQAQRVLSVIQPRLTLLDQGISKIDKFGVWATSLESIANNLNLEINSLIFSDIQAKSKIDFSFTTKGPFAQIHTLIQSLENLRSLVIVESVQINRLSGVDDPTAVIRGYFLSSHD